MLAEFNRWSLEGQMEQAAPVLSQRDTVLSASAQESQSGKKKRRGKDRREVLKRILSEGFKV